MLAAFGLFLGVLVGLSVPVASVLGAALQLVVEGYAIVAPALTFLVLAPTLLSIAKAGRGPRAQLPLWAIWWFSKLRLGACLFALAMTALLFSLPVAAPVNASSLGGALEGVVGQLWSTLKGSHYFHAIYASVLVPLLLARVDSPLIRRFAQLPAIVERIGALFTHVVPLFTLLVGVYITTLPAVLHERLLDANQLRPVRVAWLSLDGGSPRGLLVLYCVLALTTGVLTSIWHLGLLAAVRIRTCSFDPRHYWKAYFSRVYPLLWSTSSEALATPLNLHLMKVAYPHVSSHVRHVAITVGSVFNINGTMICCFVMLAAVSQLLGLPLGVLDLALCLPIIFLVGFGVPGIPGELVLFAGPLAAVLGVPPDQQAQFLLVFIGLQIGLPDSFRTGANSTDSCPAALLLEHSLRARGADDESRMAN